MTSVRTASSSIRRSLLLGTNVIVDNRAGATGTIGAAYVAKAAADGYTLLGTSIGPQAIAAHLMGKLPYDPINGFAPVAIIGTIAHILVVGANQPFKNLAELLAAAKAQPGKLAFASGGSGTILQMQGELLKQQTGAQFIHVPYKGDTPALQDTLGEQVNFMFAPAAAALQHIQSGRLRAPAGTPAPVISRLNREINTALQHADLVALGEKLGVTLVGGTPGQLGALQKSDSAKWAEVIRKGGIKAD